MNPFYGIEEFVKVVQMGSFSLAAKALNQPISTVSGKVSSLEKRLGIALIHRTTRKLSITSAGKSYYNHCKSALEELNVAENTISLGKEKPSGTIKITAPLDIGHHLLPKIVKAYLEHYPQTNVEITLTNEYTDLINEGIDLAIRAGKLEDSTLVTKKFMEIRMGLFASANFLHKKGIPKNLKQLKNHPFISFKAFGNQFRLSNNQKSKSVLFHSRITLDDMEAIKSFILNDYGIGILPTMICSDELFRGELIELLPEWKINFDKKTQNKISFVYPPQKYLSPNVKNFMEIALSVIQTEFK